MLLESSVTNMPWNDHTMVPELSLKIASRLQDVLAHQYSSPNSTPIPSLTSFPLFPNLPSEIRQHIYRLSLPHRVLSLTYDSMNNRFISKTRSPNLLLVSHEARLAVQHVYKLAFGSAKHQSCIYFNPYLDTLYLPRHGDMGYDESLRNFKGLINDPSGSLDHLQMVAIDHVDLNIKRPWEAYNKASFLRGFPGVQKIVLVVDEHASEDEAMLDSREVLRFTEPKMNPEQQLQLWWAFRQSFAAEERIHAEVCLDMGRNYEACTLPTVQIRGKVLPPPSTEVEQALEGMRK